MTFLILLVLVAAWRAEGDMCQDFCIAKLGPGACAKGSFCKVENRVCHMLLWRDSSTICVHDGIDKSCSSRDLVAVKCTDAETWLSNPGGKMLASVETTTTVRPTEFEPVPRPLRVRNPERADVEPIKLEDFQLVDVLGSGATGEVSLARRRSDGKPVAIKKMGRNQAFERELAAYSAIRGQRGFTQLLGHFKRGADELLVMSYAGPSILSVRRIGGGRSRPFSVPSAASIAVQLIDRLETLHRLGFVHLDAYPNNLAVGEGPEEGNLVLLDFGETRPWNELFPRILDIQSLSHTVLQLLVPHTPFGDFKHWDGHRPRVTLEEMCRGLPRQVLELFRYSHIHLAPDAEPDYAMLRRLMLQLVPSYRGNLVIDFR